MNGRKLLMVLALVASALSAQIGGGKPVTTGGASPGTATTGVGAPASGTTSPSISSQTPNPQGDTARPIFISGRVMMSDGSPISQSVTIQRVCNGTPRTVAYPDSSGGFGFQWGQTNTIIADASEVSFGGRSPTGMTGSSGSGGTGSSSRSLLGCDLRANLAGYRSDYINLSSRNPFDNLDIGVIVLHRNAGAEGGSVSASSLGAPKAAKKSYERGLQALQKNKPDEAAKYFENAVARYPKYADAWMSLGKLRLDQNSPERARSAMLKAIEADPKLLSSYLELGLISADARKWDESKLYMEQVVRLDPANYPVAWYTIAVADYNLKKYDDAEKSVRRAMKLDPRHGIPRVQYLLGLILEQKRDFAAAAVEFNSYLKYAPAAPDVPQVQAELRQLDKMLGEAKQAAK